MSRRFRLGMNDQHTCAYFANQWLEVTSEDEQHNIWPSLLPFAFDGLLVEAWNNHFFLGFLVHLLLWFNTAFDILFLTTDNSTST